MLGSIFYIFIMQADIMHHPVFTGQAMAMVLSSQYSEQTVITLEFV